MLCGTKAPSCSAEGSWVAGFSAEQSSQLLIPSEEPAPQLPLWVAGGCPGPASAPPELRGNRPGAHMRHTSHPWARVAGHLLGFGDKGISPFPLER